MRTDRMEQHDVSAEQPEALKGLVDEWTAWAKKVGVDLGK